MPDAPNEPSFEFQAERAIAQFESDKLDRSAFVSSLSNALLTPDNSAATGITMGLVGRWGEGKSSVLQLLRLDLIHRNPKAVVVEFSPWLVSQRNDLVRSFFGELGRAVGNEFSERIHGGRKSQVSEELIGALNDYVGRLAPVVDFVQPGGGSVLKTGSSLLKGLLDIYRDRRAEQQNIFSLKTRVQELLSTLHVPIVALIDEVDRVDDADVRELMHLVRAVADFPSISYLLAYDDKRVAEALGFEAAKKGERVARGRQYLEKIVQVPVLLPIVFDDELKQILEEEVEKVLRLVGLESRGRRKDRYRELARILVPQLVGTVRDVRRLAPVFAHRMGLLSDDVEWPDILGFVALSIFAPEVANYIRAHPNDFVFETSLVAISRKFEEFFESIPAPKSEKSSTVSELVAFLFPAISKHRAYADCLIDEIAFRTPLLALLRMKALPTSVNRRDVIALSGMEAEGLRQALNTIVVEGKANALAARLADFEEDEVDNLVGLWTAFLIAVNDAPRESWPAELNRMDALREVPDVLIRQKKVWIGLRELVLSLVDGHKIDVAIHVLRKIRFSIKRDPEFAEAADGLGINLGWIGAVGEKAIEAQKAEAAEMHSTVEVATVYLANDLGLWSDADKRNYAELLVSRDYEFDRFILQSFGGVYATDGSTIQKLFMPLSEFRMRLSIRRREIGSDAAIELRAAYDKAVEHLGIEEKG